VVYPFLGSLLYRLTGDSILALPLVSAIAGVLLIWVVYAVALELFRREGVALLSAALIGFHSEFMRASASVYREVLAALLLAFAFLTRVDAAAAIATGLIALFVAGKVPWRRRLAVCCLMAFGFCALETPYVLWMHGQTGHWYLSQWPSQGPHNAGRFLLGKDSLDGLGQ